MGTACERVPPLDESSSQRPVTAEHCSPPARPAPVRHPTTVDKSGLRVRKMFGQIARRYDLLNHLLSLGTDRRWRRRTVKRVAPPDQGLVLDVCTGTADLALAYCRLGGRGLRVVGADFCRPMLAIAGEKARRAEVGPQLTLVEADAQQLPFPDNTFDIVCVAFGLRNIGDTDQGLREMARVCRPGGRVAVLEFALPEAWPLRTLYGWYFRRVLPAVGQALARNRQAAYNYLPRSVDQFPQREALVRRMERVGLSDVEFHAFTFGVAILYVGVK